MGRNNEMVEVDVEVLAQGEKAVKVTDGDKEAWIPHSLIKDDSTIGVDSKTGDSGTLAIPQWKAEEVGFV